jgi:hypothetical protein
LQRTHHDNRVASLFVSDIDVACGGVWLSQRAQRVCRERPVVGLDEYSAHRTRDHFNWSKRLCRDPVSHVQVWLGSASRPWISFWIICLFFACRLCLDELGLCTVVRGLPHLAESWPCSACDVVSSAVDRGQGIGIIEAVLLWSPIAMISPAVASMIIDTDSDFSFALMALAGFLPILGLVAWFVGWLSARHIDLAKAGRA